jgi:hypothetical protein
MLRLSRRSVLSVLWDRWVPSGLLLPLHLPYL